MRLMLANLLLQALGWLCTEHIPTTMTRPVRCAICWRVIDNEPKATEA